MEGSDKPRVLLVDDDPLFREMVGNLLREHYTVDSAATAEEGVRSFTQEPPDAVLLDLVMPGRDGLWALRVMRREDPTVAVAILTGHGALESAKEAISLGARFYVEKPVEFQELSRTLERCVQSTREQRRQRRALDEMKGIITDLNAELQKKDRILLQARCAVELMYDLGPPLESALSQMRRLSDFLSDACELPSAEHYDRLRRSFRLLERCMERCRLLTDLSRALERDDRPELVSVGDLVRRLCDEARAWVTDAGISLDVRILARDVACRADPAVLEMALKNVLQRALENAARNSGAVRVGCVEESQRVELRVEDHGPGCDLAEMARTLRPRFSEREVREGAGLGLLLSAKAVQKYHGRFHVQSAPHKGTVVFVELPIAGPAGGSHSQSA